MVAHTELNDVSNGTHDNEANTDGLADLDELLLVGCSKQLATAAAQWVDTCELPRRTLLALVHELDTILDKVHGHVKQLLHLVGHCDGLLEFFEGMRLWNRAGVGERDGGSWRWTVRGRRTVNGMNRELDTTCTLVSSKVSLVQRQACHPEKLDLRNSGSPWASWSLRSSSCFSCSDPQFLYTPTL